MTHIALAKSHALTNNLMEQHIHEELLQLL